MGYPLKHAYLSIHNRTATMAPPKSDSLDQGQLSLKFFGGFRRTPSGTLPARSSPPVYGGSYLEALDLKLSEAVSKALAHPVATATPNELVGGKLPIPAGRGTALGRLITSWVFFYVSCP